VSSSPHAPFHPAFTSIGRGRLPVAQACPCRAAPALSRWSVPTGTTLTGGGAVWRTVVR